MTTATSDRGGDRPGRDRLGPGQHNKAGDRNQDRCQRRGESDRQDHEVRHAGHQKAAAGRRDRGQRWNQEGAFRYLLRLKGRAAGARTVRPARIRARADRPGR